MPSSRTIGLSLICGSITRVGWYQMRDELIAMIQDDAERERLKKELDSILVDAERILGPRGDNEFYRFLSRNEKSQ